MTWARPKRVGQTSEVLETSEVWQTFLQILARLK